MQHRKVADAPVCHGGVVVDADSVVAVDHDGEHDHDGDHDVDRVVDRDGDRDGDRDVDRDVDPDLLSASVVDPRALWSSPGPIVGAEILLARRRDCFYGRRGFVRVSTTLVVLHAGAPPMSLMVRLSRVLLVVSAVAVGVIASGCPGPEYPKCESDDQCKTNKDGKTINEYCLFGQCQQCAKDSQCGDGKRCNKGRCETTCSSDGECGDGSICEATRCVKAQCKSNDACGTGASCEAGRCKRTGTDGNGANGGSGGGSGGDENLKCEKTGRVQFDYNAADLRPDGRAALDNMAKCLKKNTSWRLTIEGHADERGTPEFNLSLGESRAKSIKKYLTALGVEENRVKVVSYGEEKPISNAGTEEGFAQNRRGELIVN